MGGNKNAKRPIRASRRHKHSVHTGAHSRPLHYTPHQGAQPTAPTLAPLTRVGIPPHPGAMGPRLSPRGQGVHAQLGHGRGAPGSGGGDCHHHAPVIYA